MWCCSWNLFLLHWQEALHHYIPLSPTWKSNFICHKRCETFPTRLLVRQPQFNLVPISHTSEKWQWAEWEKCFPQIAHRTDLHSPQDVQTSAAHLFCQSSISNVSARLCVSQSPAVSTSLITSNPSPERRVQLKTARGEFIIWKRASFPCRRTWVAQFGVTILKSVSSPPRFPSRPAFILLITTSGLIRMETWCFIQKWNQCCGHNGAVERRQPSVCVGLCWSILGCRRGLPVSSLFTSVHRFCTVYLVGSMGRCAVLVNATESAADT